jgi:peroxiredoxin Q/BCP
MPVTLRKRPAKEPPAAAPAPPAKKKGTVAKAVAKVKDTVKKPEPKAAKGKAKSEPAAPTAPAEPPAPKVNGAKKAPTKVAVGDIIDLEGFGGEIETNDGEKTTLKKLVDESKNGVVLFTYPKASTPGCKLHPGMRNITCNISLLVTLNSIR